MRLINKNLFNLWNKESLRISEYCYDSVVHSRVGDYLVILRKNDKSAVKLAVQINNTWGVGVTFLLAWHIVVELRILELCYVHH